MRRTSPARLKSVNTLPVGTTTGALVVSHPEQHRGRWRPRLDRPAFVALLFGLAGVVYRLVLTLYTVPVSNLDEATFGLAALHIGQGRERPVFLYGQHYMGMLESYLAAPLVAVAGPSWPVLRLPMLALYAVFLYLIDRLTRRLYSRLLPSSSACSRSEASGWCATNSPSSVADPR